MAHSHHLDYTLRLAAADDIPALATLIPLSVRTLQAAHYSSAQMEAALGPVFGVDRQLIADGTYYAVVDDAGTIVGCGGWSRRNALFGSDVDRPADDGLLDPQRDAARIRAFFVHPGWVRRGMGRALLDTCEGALRAAGFRTAELVATLPGVPLYTVAGFVPVRPYDVPLRDGLGLPVVSMRKTYQSSANDGHTSFSSSENETAGGTAMAGATSTNCEVGMVKSRR